MNLPACRNVVLILLLSTILSQVGFSKRGTTGILEGRVRDKVSGEGLIAVNVQILGTSLGAVSDLEGWYQVHSIRAGVYDVRFTLIGHTSVIVKQITILPDLRTKLDVEMEQSSVEIQPVEIVAQKPLIQKDQAATAYSIGGMKMERLPVSKFQDVLTLQPGVTIEGNVRGGKTTEVIYLVDGLPVQDVISGGLGANLPKSAVTGLIVHTGGFEAEYGNALSGVVNVVTKTGQDRNDFNARFDKDSYLPDKFNKQTDHLTELELTGSGPLIPKKLYYFTANTLTTTDTRWWQDFKNFFESPVLWDFSGIEKLELAQTETFRLGLQGIYSLSGWRDYEYSWRYDLDGLPPRSRNSYRLALTASDVISDESYLTFSVSRYYQRNHIGEDVNTIVSPTPYQYDFYLRYIVSGSRNWWADSRQLIYTVKADYTIGIGPSHLLKMGVEFNQFDLYSNLVKYEPQLTYFGKPELDQPMLNYSNEYRYYPRSGSAYFQDKIQIERDGSILSAGIRWDFLDPRASRPNVEYPVVQNDYQRVVNGTVEGTMKQQLSPRLSIAVPVGVSTFFFANVGYYFQFPLFDLLYAGTNPVQIKQGLKNIQAGNPDLQPERTIAWETGFKQGLDQNNVISITYFVKRTTNQIDSKTLVPFDSKAAGDYGFASYVNNAQGSSTGLEFVLSREKAENFTGSLSYGYMVTEGLSEVVDQSLNYSQWGFPLVAKAYPLSWDQRHTVKADLETKIIGGIQANLVVLYNTPRPFTYYPTRDGFTPVDTSKVFLPNNERMFDLAFVNLKLSKDFDLGGTGSVITIYADIRNLLNRANVRWIDSNGRIGGELADPGAYYDPRRIRIGIRMQF